MLLAPIVSLTAQRPLARPDSAQVALGLALCGPLFDDSVATGLPPGAVVSLRLSGLQRPELDPLSAIPQYPSRLRKEGVQGTVIVGLIIDTNGIVEAGSIKIISTPHEEFVPAVEQYLRQVRFRPGEIYGRPVRVCTVMPISFGVRQR